MRIGINGYYLTTQFTGIGQYSINLINALAEIDREKEYYIFVPSEIQLHKPLPSNFRIVVIKPISFFPKTFLSRYVWEEYQLGNAIGKYKIDLFHSLYQSLPRGSEKIANVVTIHDAIPWKFPAERRQFSYKLYSERRKDLVKKRAKKVITVSETSKLDFALVYGIKPETIEVTYESVDPIFFQSPSEEEATKLRGKYNIDKEFILYTGGLKRHKNLRLLIKSFDILVKEHGFAGDLYILGAVRSNMAISPAIYYSVSDLKNYAKLKGIDQRTKFVGFISREEMSAFMHLAKCFISISLYEGFGLPAVEALTSGCPSVLSNIGAYPEIADGASVFVYPYGPHRIADALNEALNNKEERMKLIDKAKKRALFFDRIKIAKRVLEIYQEVYDDYKIKIESLE